MTGLTAERLRELFFYDPIVGTFIRKRTIVHNALIGDFAGSPDKHGYLTIRIDGKSYKAHRLAWLYVHGIWPDGDLDHKNRIKSHNALGNLRPAEDCENLWNTTVRVDCGAGLKGVHVHKVRGQPTGFYRVTIRTRGKKREVGYFKCPVEAHEAYRKAANDDHGAFARAA